MRRRLEGARGARLAAADAVPRSSSGSCSRPTCARPGSIPTRCLDAARPRPRDDATSPAAGSWSPAAAVPRPRASSRRLEAAGAPTIFVPRSARLRPARRATASSARSPTARPDVVIHLAAVVGGIGANRENPGRFFYENAIMGIELMEQARLRGRREVRRRSARSAPTRSSRRCRSARTTSGTATRRRRTRPTASPRRCSSSRARPTAQQYGFNVIYLIPVNLYGPGDNFDPRSSHVIPALIKKCVDARERGRRPHRGLGHRLAPRASSSTSTTRPRASSSPPSATTAPSRSTSGVGQRDHDPRPRRADRRADRLRGRDPLGRRPSPTASRAARSTRAGRASASGSCAATSFEDGLRAHDRLVRGDQVGRAGPRRGRGAPVEQPGAGTTHPLT